MMPESFELAAARHLDDCCLLLERGRFDNAAYLAGYVVECSMKALLRRSMGKPQRFQHELPLLAEDALRLAWLITPAIRRYHLPESPDCTLLIAKWSPEMRYCRTGEYSREDSERWVRGAAEIYRAVLIESVLDGWSTLS